MAIEKIPTRKNGILRTKHKMTIIVAVETATRGGTY
jgi:hypothetical protein